MFIQFIVSMIATLSFAVLFLRTYRCDRMDRLSDLPAV